MCRKQSIRKLERCRNSVHRGYPFLYLSNCDLVNDLNVCPSAEVKIRSIAFVRYI